MCQVYASKMASPEARDSVRLIVSQFRPTQDELQVLVTIIYLIFPSRKQLARKAKPITR